MAGQHIERQARAAVTGVTETQRDDLIMELHKRKWSQVRIAKHLGITQPAVHYALKRLYGQPRIQIKYDICDDCMKSMPKTQINDDGLCPECAQ